MKIFDTQIKIHYSVLFTAALVLWQSLATNNLTNGIILGISTTILLYLIVLIHEFAHIKAAKMLGYNTPLVVLSVLGGMAHIGGLEDSTPKEHIKIAIAGPISNLILAAVLFVIIKLLQINPSQLNQLSIPVQILFYAFIVNLIMGVFNLIPAFPLDGGRILHSILRMFFQYEKATRITVYVARFYAIILVALGIYLQSVILPIIAMFIWLNEPKKELI